MTGCGGFRFNECRRAETEQLALELTVAVGNKVSGGLWRKKREKQKRGNWCNLNYLERSEGKGVASGMRKQQNRENKKEATV